MITAMLLTNGTLTVILDSGAEILTARNDHPRWTDIIAAFKAQNENLLRGLLSMKAVMEIYSNGDLTIDGTGVLFQGRPLHGVDVDRVLAFQRDGLPYRPIANYIGRCRKNTSQRAIVELYSWLEHRHITLTPDGKFIGYKGVRGNFYSVYGNTETRVQMGVTDSEGHILNEIGKTIEIDRSCVSDDFRNPCGPGLHVGSLAYANGWGQRVILVEVDPADVVSIPSDCDCQKLRCCKYRVVGEYTGPLPDTYTTEFSEDICPQCGLEECECDDIEEEDVIGPINVRTNSNSEEGEFTIPQNELEQAAQDAGILPGGLTTGDLKKMDEDLVDDFESDYLAGMKAGVEDKTRGVAARYMAGDQAGADSARHAQYISGYLNGYSD
jgi:hypothetical protein